MTEHAVLIALIPMFLGIVAIVYVVSSIKGTPTKVSVKGFGVTVKIEGGSDGS